MTGGQLAAPQLPRLPAFEAAVTAPQHPTNTNTNTNKNTNKIHTQIQTQILTQIQTQVQMWQNVQISTSDCNNQHGQMNKKCETVYRNLKPMSGLSFGKKGISAHIH